MATQSETMEEMVVYRALYGDGGLWTRGCGKRNPPAAPLCSLILRVNRTVPVALSIEPSPWHPPWHPVDIIIKN